MSGINTLTAIGNGLAANDGTGDALRSGAAKINGNNTAIVTAVNNLAASQSAGMISYLLKSDMTADLAHADGVLATVTNDPTDANNAVYRKSGASGSGSWVLTIDRATIVKNDLASTVTGKGAALVGFVQAGTGAVARTVQDKQREFPSVEDYGAVGDYDYTSKTGTDDWAAIQAAVNAHAVVTMQPVHYRVTKPIVVPAGHKIIGHNTATFAAYVSVDLANNTRVTKTAGDTDGDSVFQLGDYASISGVVLLAEFSDDPNPSSGGANLIHSAVYPATLNNTSNGIRASDYCSIRNCVFKYFANAGLNDNGSGSNVNVVEVLFSHFSGNKQGIGAKFYDSKVFGNTFAHNNYGISGSGQYWEVTCNRFEWNSHEGCYLTGAEHRITGNLFDRNGFSGVRLGSAWGACIVGNYFSRNGAGGAQFAASPIGRWGYSIPGDASYIATADADSCHIRMDAQRDVVVTGNRFRVGVDDTGLGVSSPAYVFNVAATSQFLQIHSNAGVSAGGGGFGGFNPSYEVDTGSPSPRRDFALVFGDLSKSIFFDFPSCAAGGFQTTSVTVVGAVLGDRVTVGCNIAIPDGMILQGKVSAADTVVLSLFNFTAGALNLGSATFYIKVESRLNRTSE